jgi:hypothetical protein
MKLQPLVGLGAIEEEATTASPEFLNVAELINLETAAQASGFSISHLRAIAQRGRLWAVKKGKSWFTTLAAVEEYKHDRYRIIKKEVP